MKRVIKSSTSVESDFLGAETNGDNEVSFRYQSDEHVSNLDAVIVDGANKIFGDLSSETYYDVRCIILDTEDESFEFISPTVYAYKRKNGRWYFDILAFGLFGMRNAIARAHLQVTGEYKSPNNKFKYTDADIAKQVFIEATKIAAEKM